MDFPLSGPGKKLRVGILVDSEYQPAWVHEIVSELAGSCYADVALVVRCPSSQRVALRAPPSDRRKIPAVQPLFASRCQPRQNTRERACAPGSAPASRTCPRIVVIPIQGRFTDEFHEEDLRRIAGDDLDVMLRFGFRILKGGILDTPRHGIWSHHHDDNRELPASVHALT
jgi:hypothetical protein